MTTTTAREYAQDVAASLSTVDVGADDFDIYEYLEGQALDYRRVVNSRGDTVEVQLLVACGGPTAWLDIWPTSDGYSMQVRASWYSDEVTASVALGDALAGMMWDVYTEGM